MTPLHPTRPTRQVITRPNSCEYDKYRSSYSRVHNCPYEVDCGGAVGNFVRVRLPGPNRAVSLASVDVYRSKPPGLPVETAAEDPKRCVYKPPPLPLGVLAIARVS